MLGKIVLNIIVFMVVILLSLPLFFKDSEDPVEANKQKQAEEVKYNLTDVTLVGHNAGEKQWQLMVNTITDKGKDKAVLDGLKQGELYQNGEVRYHLAATGGEYNRSKDEFTLKSNVVINGVRGETIQADEIKYSNFDKKLTSGPVKITDEQVKVQAGQMAIDVNQEIFQFSGGVQVNFTIGEDEEETVGQDMGGEEDVKQMEKESNRVGNSDGNAGSDTQR